MPAIAFAVMIAIAAAAATVTVVPLLPSPLLAAGVLDEPEPLPAESFDVELRDAEVVVGLVVDALAGAVLRLVAGARLAVGAGGARGRLGVVRST